jgi:vacuolar-type H+-ATPase subunit H
MKFKAATITLAFFLAASSSVVRAQQPAATIALAPNQIGLVKTTQGITTRITFPDAVRDIICGDLYDSNTGKGGFVVQRIDNDVFLKPVVSKGLSNLFVKTGEKGDHTYSFDLEVVPTAQAYRIVSITNAPNAPAAQPQQSGAPDQPAEASQKILSLAQQQSDEMQRAARQKADQILAQANQRASELYAQALKRAEDLDRQASERAQQGVEDRFVRAMIQGVRDIKTSESHVIAKKVTIALDSRVLTFDEKSFLRYTIKNNGDKEFSFSAISLETGTEKSKATIPIKVIQGRIENKLKPGDAIMGIIVFDPKMVSLEDKLTLYVRGEGNAEIARLSIQ